MTGTIDCVIVGSGVIGLTAALELHKAGHRPAIVARDLPEDSLSIGFASPWAGANWHSFEQDENSKQLQWDIKTYKHLGKLAQEIPDIVEEHEFLDVYDREVPVEAIPWRHAVKNFRLVKATADRPLPGKAPWAHAFTAYTINAPMYIQHLAGLIRARNISIIRKRLTSIHEAYDLPEIGPVDLVVNATGLGARSLGGVGDDKVYGARGQTLLVKAPKAQQCIMKADAFASHASRKAADPEPAPPPYIIPRPGTGGGVIIGGTYEKGVYSTLPDLAQAKRTLQDCYQLDPRLAGEGGTSWQDIQVMSVNVGIRPCREGGPRVELERRKIRDFWQHGLPPIGTRSDREVSVIHTYGFGGVGFISSIGAGAAVTDLASQHRTSSGSGGHPRAKL